MPPTTGGRTPIAENLFYLGYAKQAQWGTAVAPTQFVRWQDGTDVNADPKIAKEREGDSSPYITLIYKSGQYWAIKIVQYVRPIGVGSSLQALLGSGSDTYTAPAQSTTLAAAVAAGATAIEVAAALGNTGTLAVNLTPGYSSAIYEVVTLDLTTESGTGPYTYTLANGTKTRNAHLLGDAVTSASTHVFTRQSRYDAYSLEYAFGDGVNQPFQAIRLRDSVCTDITLTSAAGKPLKLEETWLAADSALEAALASVVLEGSDVVGAAGGPLMHSQAQSQWLVDGASTGNAAMVKQFKLTLKNSTTWDEFQAESIFTDYFIPGTFDVDGQADVIFQSYEQYMETYYGSSSPAPNATDSYLTGYGSIATTWIGDVVNSLGISLPNVAYTAAKMTPKRDSKPLMQSIVFSGAKLGSTIPFTATLNNSQNSQY